MLRRHKISCQLQLAILIVVTSFVHSQNIFFRSYSCIRDPFIFRNHSRRSAISSLLLISSHEPGMVRDPSTYDLLQCSVAVSICSARKRYDTRLHIRFMQIHNQE